MIFLFFGSSLACLEPELELFEVWEINVRQIIIIANGINSQTPKLQTALARVLDELERNQKKGKSSSYNFQDDGHISVLYNGYSAHIYVLLPMDLMTNRF